jgi:FkbM family methyltransferase
MSIFLPKLKQCDRLSPLHITICNVGSRKLGAYDDYGTSGWNIFAPNLTILGFDADADACEAANAALQDPAVSWTEDHLPFALSNVSGETTLYVTKAAACSSLYAPNEPYLERFASLPEFANLDFTVEIPTTTLDEVCQERAIEAIDFLQIDVQGADLQVLQGGAAILSWVLAVQVEVEFSHLYCDQPLFADVDAYLRSQGFTLFDLSISRRVRRRSPICSTIHPGQALWGEAFYFRDLLQNDLAGLQPTPPEQLFKLACIADAMEFPDYALELLEYLTINYGNNPTYNFADAIVAALSDFPELVAEGLDNLPVVARVRGIA